MNEELEKAAGEYEKNHTYQRYDGGGLTPEYDATLAEAFIAGAEWRDAQIPKLPDDVDEAAKQFVGYDMDTDELRDYEIGVSSFKAGAEWKDRSLNWIRDLVKAAIKKPDEAQGILERIDMMLNKEEEL